jgi:hypothetical protein
MEMFRFKTVSQFAEPYHSIVSCALKKEVRILNNFYKFN